MTVTVELEPEQMRRLEEAAAAAEVTPPELVESAIADLLDRRAEFARIKRRVLDKNAELLRRLAQ